MKFKTILLAGLAAMAVTSSASAQTVINITGATGFRAAAHQAIIAILGGAGTVKYCYVGSSINNANQAIFEGAIGGNPYIIRTRQSGSEAGIHDVATQTPITTYLSITATAALPMKGS